MGKIANRQSLAILDRGLKSQPFSQFCCIGMLKSENSRRLWLFPGSVRGFPRKPPGKSRENCWKIFPGSRNAINSRISGTGKGKPAGNLGSTLPGPCPHLPCGVFFEIDSSSLLEFFWLKRIANRAFRIAVSNRRDASDSNRARF